MKKSLVLIALSICFAFSSCSTEESVVSQKDNLDVKINTVRLSDIPLIKEELSKIKLEKVKHRNALARSIDDFNLNEDKIIALEKDNYSSYTFIVEQPIEEASAYIVENLVIETIGTSYNAYIVKYIPNDGNPFYNIHDFNGSIKYETLDGDTVVDIPINTTMSEDSFPTDEYTVTIGSWTYVLIYAGGSWSVGSATYTGGNNSSGSTGGNNTGGNPSDNSSGNGYHNGGGGSNNYVNPGSGGSSSTVPNIPTNDEVLAKKYTAFLNNLSPQQYQFLATNNNVNNAIFNYLEEGFFSVTRKEFATQFIQNSITSGLNLDFEKSLNSPANIDISEIDTTSVEGQKFNCVYKKLMQSQSFKNLVNNTFGVSDKINLKFEIVQNLSHTQPNGTITYPNGTSQLNTNVAFGVIYYNNTIKLSGNNLLSASANKSNFEIAKTIIHEIIHAYLNIKRKGCSAASIPQINSHLFPELISSFYTAGCSIDVNNADQSEHAFMFDHMIPAFQMIFAEIRDILATPNNISEAEGVYYDNNDQPYNWNWQDFYKYFSMNGLHNNNAFTTAIISNPSNNFLYAFYVEKGQQFSKTCN